MSAQDLPGVRVLSVCRHGAGRSQILAAGLARGLEASGVTAQLRVVATAPREPHRPVPQSVRTIMAEVGLTPVQEHCRALEESDLAWAEVVVCLAEVETWPASLREHPGLRVLTVEDGSGRDLEFQRQMRDEVLAHVPEIARAVTSRAVR